MAALAISCRATNEDRDRPAYSKTSETARDDFEHTRKTYAVHVNERLNKLDQRIHELAAKGTEKAKQAADALRAERDRLKPKLDAIGQQAKAGWDNFESDVSQAFDTLEQKLDAAFAD